MRRLLLSIIFVLSASWIFPQVLINEFSSSNIGGLTDEDGDYHDWIEFYNNTASAADLNGFYLSDNAFFLKKWTFPAVKIDPFSYLIVFASGKDRREIPVRYKTIIPRYAAWQYLVPASEPGQEWKNPGFNASGWQTGPSGFGFGDDDDSTVLDKISSVYIRKEFNLARVDYIREIVLSIDYDDGFIAFINGHEIARSNVGTTATIPYNKVTGTGREAVMFSGGTPENFIIKDISSFLIQGTNVIAIQGYNSGASSTDFSLIPMLTVGISNSGLVDSIPSYIRLKGRKLHTNFKIDAGGETLFLSKPDSSRADLSNPVMITDNLSWGRKPDAGTTWRYFDIPTPGASNISRSFGSLSIDTIIFSSGGGYYSGTMQLHLSSNHQSDSIFYTLDGSEPTDTSLLYRDAISLSGNVVIRARSIKSGRMPGVITSNTYYKTDHTLPVVCISTNPANLWDYYTGIYVDGPNAAAANPHFGANYWQDWEKKGHMELYDVKGIKQIDQDIGIKIFGAWSRAHAQKSFALYARKEYGKGSIEYSFFKDKPTGKFESIVLRNGGNDWNKAMMRDGITSTLVRDMDIDRSAFQPSVVYLNGKYWGILNIREKISNNYLAENQFVDPAKVNLLEANSKIVDGTNMSYTSIIEYLNNNTLETDSKYQLIKSKIDVNNYIRYMFTEVFIDNKDWPGNNIKYWNTVDPGSLWRWILYDTDFGLGIYDQVAYSYNTLAFALAPESQTGANKPWATLLFRRMMSNAGFRNEFANQYADRMNRNFLPERINSVVDSIKLIFDPEMPAHQTRWNLSIDNWVKNINIIRLFAENRTSFARSHLVSQLNLGTQTEISVEIASPGTGKVKVNSIIPYSFPFSGVYFKDLPIQLTALPSPGYRFKRWEMGSLMSNDVSMTYNMAAPATFTAVFEIARNLDVNIVINEICYSSSAERDTEDWIEIYNAGKSTVNLKDWRVDDGGAEADFVFPDDLIFYPGMYVVVCRDMTAFRGYFTGVKNSTGDMAFGLSSSGEKINLFDPDGNLVDFADYRVVSPWPANVAEGGSIELTDPFSDNNDGKNWRAGPPAGTPGGLNSVTREQDVSERNITGCRLSCYPNPFTDYTTMRVEIDEAGKYRIDVYNVMGILVNTISDQFIEHGEYYIDWYGEDINGSPMAAGVYTVKLTGNNNHFITRVIMLK